LKRKFVSLLFVLLFLSPVAVLADNMTAAWNSGVEAYGNKDYEKSKNSFEEVKKDRPTDPSVYFNLGNAYYKLDNIGKAVLNYESAFRLSPRSKDIRKNLEIAANRVRIQLTDTRLEVLRWGYYVSRVFREGELVLSCLLLWSLFLGLTIFRFTRLSPWVFTARRWVFFLGLGSLLLLGLKYFDEGSRQAVIIQPEVQVRFGPSVQEKPAFRLTEGVVVGIGDEVKGWYRIDLPGDETGWVPKASLGLIQG
jgi:tetratricopeptide (TPR) repeat protein